MIPFLCRLSLVIVLSMLLISAQTSSAVELGLGASVRLGVQDHKTIQQQIEDIKNHPEKNNAWLRFSNAPKSKDLEALASCSHLESLWLVIDKFPRDLNLKPLARLTNLNKLKLVFRAAPRDLQFLTTMPKLTDLELYCRLDMDQTSQPTIQVPPLQTIKFLKLGGGEILFQFKKGFNFQTLEELTLTSPLLDQSVLANAVNLKKLVLDIYGKLDSNGLEAVSHLVHLQDFSTSGSGNFPISSWTELKTLRLRCITPEELSKISKLTQLESLSVEMDSCPDDVLALLGNLKNLQKLYFKVAYYNNNRKLIEGCTGTGLAALSKCPVLTELTIGGVPYTPKFFESLSQLKSLKSLCLEFCNECGKIDPELISPLDKLVNLEKMPLYFSKTDAISYIKKLTHLKHIKTLWLEEMDIHDKDVELLLNYPEVTDIDLSRNYLTDASLVTLSKLRNLEKLKLTGNPIQGADLRSVTNLPDLHELYLNWTQVSDAAFQPPLSNKSITRLDLSGTRVTGIGLSTLNSFSALKELGLAASGTDKALEHLKSDSLESVSIDDSEVTEHGINALANLPKVTLINAHGCGIKFGSRFPEKLKVASQSGWYDYDYDPPVDRESNRKLDEKLIRRRLSSGKISEFAHHYRANAYASIGEYKQAISEYDKAIDDLVHPKSYVCSLQATGHTHRVFDCYDGRGWCLAAIGEYSKALEDFNKANEIARASAYARMHRGYVFLKMGKLDDALSDLNRAIDIRPEIAAAYDYRSQTYSALGKTELALQDKETSRKLGYKPAIISGIKDSEE